jgi:crotonobetainyl-CoA:carnitine CoA-transferase CaiB-like acyl-CoA transferase
MYTILDGVRVIEVATWTFVPSAGATLADWGAQVVKIEEPITGDPQRGLVNALTADGRPNPMLEIPNRGKRSIGIDLKHPRGRDIAYRLIRSADVFLTNLRRSALEKLELDLASVRAQNADIVYARGTGYGTRGPDADKGGFDGASTWSRAGIAFQMTRADHEPPIMPGSIGDLVGGLSCAAGIAGALFHRERTGEAVEVDVSLYGVGMWIMSQSITAAPMGLSPMAASREEPLNALVNPYRTRDGRWIQLVMLQSDRCWPDLCRRADRPELIDDPRFSSAQARVENVSECIRTLDEVFATKTLDEWREALEGAEGVWDAVTSPLEVSEDSQALINGYLPEVEHWNGERYRVVATPVQFGGEHLGAVSPSPEHAQHTEEVLLELGCSWDDIVSLKDDGAIT